MRSRDRLLILLAFVAFVSLGLPDTLLGVAWPSIRASFQRPLGHIALLIAAGSAGYFTSSFLAGQLMRMLGVGKLLAGSSALVTAALIAIAISPVFAGLIFSALLAGLGAGAIDAGINTFAASRFSPRVVNWLHASWGIGATLGPLTMTLVLGANLSWRAGYGVIALMLAALTILFLCTTRLWTLDSTAAAEAPGRMATIGEALARPAVLLQILLFFVYCGIEATAGQLLYTLFTEVRGIDTMSAGLTVSGYWAALTLGRILFGQLTTTLGPRTILRVVLGLAPLASLLIWLAPVVWIGLAGAVLLGFCLAPIFPTLISLTPAQVGPYYAPQSVGFQVSAATFGIMAFPALVTMLARWFTLEVLGVYLLVATIALALLHEFSTRIRIGSAWHSSPVGAGEARA